MNTQSPTIDTSGDAVARVLNAVDERQQEMTALLQDLVRIPSISGSDDENEAIAHAASLFRERGLDVDHWQIPLADITVRPPPRRAPCCSTGTSTSYQWATHSSGRPLPSTRASPMVACTGEAAAT